MDRTERFYKIDQIIGERKLVTFATLQEALEVSPATLKRDQLLLVKEYQRLKENESNNLKLGWNLQRTLAKVNYRIHTDAIKENLIPPALSKEKINFVYANEADMLNVALFGITAKEWRNANPKTPAQLPHSSGEGNVRDAASIEQLVVLSNMESINAVLIHQGLPQNDRLQQLNKIAITQMKSLLGNQNLKKLK